MSKEVYLSINKKDFEDTKKEAEEQSISDGDEETLTWTDLAWNIDDSEIIDDKLYLAGSLEDFGYLSIDVKLDLDVVIDLIEWYIKKINKVKTMLEASK